VTVTNRDAAVDSHAETTHFVLVVFRTFASPLVFLFQDARCEIDALSADQDTFIGACKLSGI
jgi:hypothetical protein